MKIIVLGAGPAGLSAAWHLSQKGASVEVLEAENQVGGLCRSIHHNGYIFDLGGHRFITKDEGLLNEIESLMGNELLVMPRKSVIRLQGKFFSYPLEIFDVFKKMNPWISFRSGLDFLIAKVTQSSNPDISFEDWIVKRFGRTMYDIYFGPYTQKLWGMPPKQISANWAAQRIPSLNLWNVFLRAIGKKKEAPKTYALNFLYPQKGIGRICDRMKEEIEKKSEKVHLNAKVKKILLSGNTITEITYEKNNADHKISADFVVSTIPLPEFIKMIEPRVDEKYLTTANSMKFRGIKFLFLTINKKQVTDNTWIYIPEEEYLFFRIQEMRNWSPGTVPEEKTALTLEIACDENDSIWNAPDKDIFDRCICDLKKLGLIEEKDVLDYFTYKVKHAYPVYFLDYQERVKNVYTYLAQIKNHLSIGRQGLYRYNNMDHSIKMGLLTAKHILEGYPRQKILEIATENIIFDWQDPGYFDGGSKS